MICRLAALAAASATFAFAALMAGATVDASNVRTARGHQVLPPLTLLAAVAAVPPESAGDRWLVATRDGRVWSREEGAQAVVLDWRDVVRDLGPGTGLTGITRVSREDGTNVLGVAFVAPRPWRVVVAVAGAEPTARRVLVEVPFDQPVHLGGALAAGSTGQLYVGLGDGGAPLDPYGNAQDRRRLPGSLLRLDLDHVGAQGEYGVPASNPWAGVRRYREEIWAYGFAAPRDLAFDSATGEVWCVDDGAPGVAEVNRVRGGGNYGWNIRAGHRCVEALPGCEARGLEPPIHAADSAAADLLGGYVDRRVGFAGHYLYGDRRAGAVLARPASGGGAATRVADLPSDAVQLLPGPDGRPHALAANGALYRLQ